MEFGHSQMEGRPFMSTPEGYKWYLMTSAQRTMFCKMDEMNYVQAKKGQSFEIWHPCMMTDQGLAPLSPNTKTLEPWLMLSYVSISELHPDFAKELEKAFEEMTRKVKLATAAALNALPKIGLVK